MILIFFPALKSLVLDHALDKYTRSDFGEIYLFFDYDAHVGMPYVDGEEVIGDDVISLMLDYFNDESDNGLLYLSYPMAEALQHFRDESAFLPLTAKCKGRNCLTRHECADRVQCTSEPRYKEQVNKYAPQLAVLSKVTQAKWAEIVLANLKKLNLLMTGAPEYPSCRYSQKNVFSRQQVFISQTCPQVAVLSAFPVFLFDYLGVEATAAKIAARS